MLRGPRGTFIPHNWWARKQGVTARNTAEAETASFDEGTFSEALPLQGVMEQILARPVRVATEQDNTASISAITRGYSRRLAYLRK